jgi:hypothetical protein
MGSDVQVTETGLILPDNMTFEDWAEYGQRLQRMSRAVMWWLGDWWRFGVRTYGTSEAKAALTRYSYQTCMNAGSVARQFEFSRRRENVRWEEHKVLCSRVLSDEDQDRLLDEWEVTQPTTAAARTQASKLKRAYRLDAREPSEIPGECATISLASYEDWLPSQPHCDLLLTDPPYSTDMDDIESFANRWLPMALNKVAPTGRAYVCIGAYPDELRTYLSVPVPQHLTLANVLVWTYRNTIGPSPDYDYKLNWQAILYYRGQDALKLRCPDMVEQFTVQDINAPDGRRGDRWHAWQKPDELGSRFVRHATQLGDLVLDPFAGTGTFLLAAAALGRKAFGCEISEANLDIAVERGCQL